MGDFVLSNQVLCDCCRLFQYVSPQHMRRGGYTHIADFISRYELGTDNEDVSEFISKMASSRVLSVIRDILTEKGRWRHIKLINK